MKSPFRLDATPALTADESAKLRGLSVLVDGVFSGNYSLAIVNRHLVRALLGAGLNVSCFCQEAGWRGDRDLNAMPDIRARMLDSYPAKGSFDIHLRNTWPPETADMVGTMNAYVCFAWEEMELPFYMVERFSRDLDLVMVTSNFVRDAFLHAGVDVPVEVVGIGCDHILGVAAASLPTARRLKRVLHISSSLPRKGADLLAQAFAETFDADDGIELVIKTFPNPQNIIQQQVARIRTELPRSAPIEIIETSLTMPEVVALYRSAALFVGPSRGEGFGLPFAEAMLHGVPVAATDYSG